MNIKKHIPDFITSMNLLCGTIGIIFALNGKIDIAFYLMISAAIFDFFDGFAARALKASSGIGKELDSLADMVSFGVLPSIMLYMVMTIQTGVTIFSGTRNIISSFPNIANTLGIQPASWWEIALCFTPLLIAIFSALRLAKFNLDTRQTVNFIGLATPACAMICGSLSYLVMAEPDSFIAQITGNLFVIPILAMVLSGLLVSEISMFSMKIKKGDEYRLTNNKRIAFLTIAVLIAIIVAILGENWSLFVLLTFITYILMNIIFALFPATREEL